MFALTMCVFACCVWLVCAQNGDTALIYAAERGHISVVELLLNRGAQVNMQNNVSMECGWCVGVVCERRKKTHNTATAREREREHCVLLL